MCSRYLASAKRQGDYIVLDLSLQEANHAESEEESDLLNSACDAIELHI